jgi:hypothetical protein
MPENITLKVLQDYHVPGWGPKGCFSRRGREDIIITRVFKFTNKRDRIIASMIFRFLIPE